MVRGDRHRERGGGGREKWEIEELGGRQGETMGERERQRQTEREENGKRDEDSGGINRGKGGEREIL